MEHGPSDSDEHLLARIKAGDRQALAVLYARYLPSIWRFVYARLRGDDHASRDVVSETFLAAIRTLNRGEVSVVGISPWLTGIARHKIADAQRSAMKPPAPQAPPSAESDPLLTLEVAETRWRVAQVMDQMEDTERILLEWKYLEELSVHQIAQRLKRTEKSIEALLYRARNSFRDLYEKPQQAKA